MSQNTPEPEELAPGAASHASPEVVLFSTDLMLISSVGGAARSSGCTFRAVSSVEQLANRTQTTLLCVDLSASAANLESIASAVAELLPNGIAFGPHVHTGRLEAAAQIGFGRVMSRGQFVASLHKLFVRVS